MVENEEPNEQAETPHLYATSGKEWQDYIRIDEECISARAYIDGCEPSGGVGDATLADLSSRKLATQTEGSARQSTPKSFPSVQFSYRFFSPVVI